MSVRAELRTLNKEATRLRYQLGKVTKQRDSWRARYYERGEAIKRMSENLDRFIPREIDRRGHL